MLDVGQFEIIAELDIMELSIGEDIIELSIDDIELSIVEFDMQSSNIEELDIIEASMAEDELL